MIINLDNNEMKVKHVKLKKNKNKNKNSIIFIDCMS